MTRWVSIVLIGKGQKYLANHHEALLFCKIFEIIGQSKQGRLLFVVWDQNKHVKNLITCFPPNQVRVEIYERAKKKKATR